MIVSSEDDSMDGEGDEEDDIHQDGCFWPTEEFGAWGGAKTEKALGNEDGFFIVLPAIPATYVEKVKPDSKRDGIYDGLYHWQQQK